MIKCKICEHECDDNKLSNHLWNKHRIVSKDYFIGYLGNGVQKCKYCNNDAKLLDLIRGFHSICQDKKCEHLLRSESAKANKAMLKRNEDKFNRFKERTSLAVKKIWENRTKTGEDEIIRKKISKTQKETIATMAIDERKEKFGWMNRPSVTAEKKREIWENSLGKYYENLTDEEMIAHFKKCHSGGKFISTHSNDVKLSNLVISNLNNFFNMDELLWQE